MHLFKIHFRAGGFSFKEADRCTLEGALVCLYSGDSLTAVMPRRMVTRIEEQPGWDIATGDPPLNRMNVLANEPPEMPQ